MRAAQWTGIHNMFSPSCSLFLFFLSKMSLSRASRSSGHIESVGWLLKRRIPEILSHWISGGPAACVGNHDDSRGLLSSLLRFLLLALPTSSGLAKEACAGGGAGKTDAAVSELFIRSSEHCLMHGAIGSLLRETPMIPLII